MKISKEKLKEHCKSPECLWNNFCAKRDKSAWKIFTFTFFTGVILYFRMITMWLASPDGVWVGLIEKSTFGWENQLGRIGLQIIGKLKDGYVFPALQTICCIAMIAAITIFICDIFEINKILWEALIGMLLLCSPSLCSTLTYYYTADAYILAFLCAVLFVWVLKKYQGLIAWVSAILLLAISLSLYQAYAGTAITLSVLYLLFLLLRRGFSWQGVLAKGAVLASTGMGGIVLYLVCCKVYNSFTGITAASDRGFDRMGQVPIQDIGRLCKGAYKAFFDYFLTDNLYNNSWYFRGKANLFLILLLLVLCISIIIFQKLYCDIKKMLLFLVLVAILPIAFMSIVIMAPEASVYQVTGILMLPHMNFLFIFIIVLAASFAKKEDFKEIFQWLTAVGCGGVIYILILYSQIFQSCMELELNTTRTLAEQIIVRLESMSEAEIEGGIIIGGRADKGNYPKLYPEMYAVVSGTAVEYGYMWSDINGQQVCWGQFFRQYLGVNYNMCSGITADEIMATTQYQNMPMFPSEGSVQMIEGHVVVKLSDL